LNRYVAEKVRDIFCWNNNIFLRDALRKRKARGFEHIYLGVKRLSAMGRLAVSCEFFENRAYMRVVGTVCEESRKLADLGSIE